MTRMLKEFREFAMRGNMIALAPSLFLRRLNTLRKQFERDKAEAMPIDMFYQERLFEETRDLLKKRGRTCLTTNRKAKLS